MLFALLLVVSCVAASTHKLSAGFLGCGKEGQSCPQKYSEEITAFIGATFEGNYSNLGIVGGDVVSPRDKYPWMAGTRRSAAGASGCGGILISPTFVLTAAHCGRRQWVAVNTFYRSGTDDGTQVMVANEIVHPEYHRSSGRNDFKLLELEAAVDVEPIVLDTSTGDDSCVGTTATAIGWGAIREGGPTSPELREVDVDVVSNRACNEALQHPRRPIDGSMVCAGGVVGEDACQGDSGGPLINKESRVLIGVVSWGIGCARAGLPGVYGRVSAVRDWIDETVEDVKWA
eukprot:CAMPEP_0205821472 /NCGR_PEP_ID=MMETSP0206-20130828/7887_1 /ASSEMBLY_ACC=CAM_ASM_000279 /TAXON_ID=36767 /ORGANISM="Euplotes focardii, Strain TN1" /LENGTH=287 /DNA_ID=CAMNT_0053116979 /DNA_START=27 /DNA_END=890 /DNA_ORIENTATION=-